MFKTTDKLFLSSLQGGIKAVIWADVLQNGVVLAGVIACLVEGTLHVGGMGRVWEIAEEGLRVNFNKY